MKISKTAIAIALSAIVGLSACSRQSVPPGHSGKILGKHGYGIELLSVGRHTVWWTETLVLLDQTTNLFRKEFKVTMRDSSKEGDRIPGLDMTFEISLRFRLKDDPNIINAMFNDIKVKNDIVTANQIFGIYAMPTIETVFRDVVGEYTPELAYANRAEISSKLGAEISKRLAKSPIEVSDVMMVSATLPPLISQRIEKNKDRELQIAAENAQQEIELVKRKNAIVLASKDAEKNLIDAQAAAAQNRELSKGLTPEVLRLRELEIQRVYADAMMSRMSKEGNASDTVFIPYDALNSVGVQNKVFRGQ